MANEVQTVQEDEIDLLDLIGVLFRHKWLIILTTGLAALFILAFSIISLKLPPDKSYLPNTYKPVSTVKINSGDSGGLSSLIGGSDLGALGSLIGLGSAGKSSSSALAVKLAKSRTVVDQLAEEFNLGEVYKENIDEKFPVTSLRNIITESIDVTDESATGTLLFTYEDIDRELATKIVNRLVEILEESFAEIDLTSNRSQKTLTEQKLEEADSQMRQLQNEILAFQDEYKVLDATTMAEEFTIKLMEFKTELVVAEAELAFMRDRAPLQDPALRLKELEVEGLKEVLTALESGKGSSGFLSIKEMPAMVMAFEEKKRLLAAQASIYAALLQQYEMLKLQDKGTGPTFQVLELAEVPEMKAGPSRGKLSIIVTMAAFFLSIFGAFLKEFWDNLNKDPKRMAKLKGRG